jgi:hypothetical protein
MGRAKQGRLVQAGGEGCGKMNMVQILCTHVCKWKMRPVETIPGMGGEDKGE